MPSRLLPLLLVLMALLPSVARVAIVHRCAGTVIALDDCCCDHGRTRWMADELDRCCEIVSQGVADAGFAPGLPTLPPDSWLSILREPPPAPVAAVPRPEPAAVWPEPRGPPRTPRFLRHRSILC